MADSVTPPVTPAADPVADALKAKQAATDKINGLKKEAHKKLAEAKKAQEEAEAILYADWGPGKSGTRPVHIPDYPDGQTPPLIQGKEMVGVQNLTYDTYREVLRMVTFRAWQEQVATKGYHKGIQRHDLSTNRITLIDAWSPDSNMVSSK